MIEIELVPTNKPGNYWPMVDGRKLRKATRQPFLDGARVLLDEGVSPETEIVGRHRGSATIALQSTVGEAARWSVTESDRTGLSKRPWMAFSRHPGNPPAADEGAAGIPEPPDPRGPLRGMGDGL